jgi:hypothetical protein
VVDAQRFWPENVPFSDNLSPLRLDPRDRESDVIERARKIADALPAEDPNRAGERVDPHTMLWGTAYQVDEHAGDRFDELREFVHRRR